MTAGQRKDYAQPVMDAAFWTDRRVAGGALVGSLAMLLLAMVILLASRAVAGFGAMTSGELAEAAPYASQFRPQITLFALGWIVQLLGLSLLTHLLLRAAAPLRDARGDRRSAAARPRPPVWMSAPRNAANGMR